VDDVDDEPNPKAAIIEMLVAGAATAHGSAESFSTPSAAESSAAALAMELEREPESAQSGGPGPKSE
jgi:hypothetical protein